jgi:hypothetical protein
VNESQLKRFEAKYIPEPNSGCWLWDASVNTAGYGQLNIEKRPRLAHRLAYEHYVGPIPEGMHVCHRCDVPACCNPNHLFIGTHLDNMRDMDAKGAQALEAVVRREERGLHQTKSATPRR